MTQKTGKKIPLKVLYLEDSSHDVEIIRDMLDEAGFELEMDCADKEKAFAELLKTKTYDIILSDFSLPGFNAFGALKLQNEICPDTPFICVSGSIGEDTAIDLIRKGAVDYVLKDRLMRLPLAIQRALDEKQSRIAQGRAEEALLESERRFKALAENSPVGIFQTNAEGGTIYVNPQWCKITGLSDEEAMGLNWLAAVHPDDKERLDDGWKKATIKQDYSYAEYRFVHKDGEIAWVLGQAIPIKDARNAIVGYVGTITDITERKAVEEELKFRNILMSTQQEVSIDGIVVTSDTGKILSYNKQFIKMWGISQEAIETRIDRLILETIFGKMINRERSLARLSDILAHKDEINWNEIELTDSRIFDHYSAPMWGSDNKYYGRVWYFRDITERKKTEQALIESEKSYRELIDGMNETVWIIDFNGDLIDVNNTATNNLGYTKEELIKIGLFGIDASLKREDIKMLVKSMPADEIQIFETTHKAKNGKIIPVEIYSSLVTYHGKKAILSIARDITERKRTEEALRQMQKLEGLGTLAGGIAHDFNNILGIILAYNTSIRRFSDDASKLDLATDTISKAVERGKTLVQQILTFARKSETTFGAVNVNEVVMEILTMIFETFPKTLTYVQNFEKRIPFINADRSQLYQAILNLCVNARDAMPNGGQLTINTHLISGRDLLEHHTAVQDVKYVCIEVSDTGEGMSEEVKKRIFEPFFTTKGIGKGTGLGLAVVFGVVQTHKGFIDVESEPGRGTAFRLYLPAIKAVEPDMEKEEEEKLEDIPGGRETVLVVEDEEMLVMSLQMLLEEKGYNVLTARDGLEALEIYEDKKEDIALVLTDLGLPTITGLEVCQRIKKIKSSEHLVLATGYLDPDMKAEFVKSGIQHFLFKPYDMKAVLKIIREILDTK
ncbi:MAG: PAS domain S-box protein [Bacteroidetes bacterium]|nr:PAS domain S-box protein [Bacteroidota bacterium]